MLMDCRMSRDTFEKLVSKLEENPIFISTGHKPQRPVRYQLGCFLIRFGMLGSDTLRTAALMGIGFGTVFLYCQRVTRALRELGVAGMVEWGDRTFTKQWIRARTGLKYCIGIVDGTLIQLTAIPRKTGFVYFCRKKFVAVC